MPLLRPLLLLVSGIALAGCATVSPSEDSARRQAENWLAWIDAGRYDAAYAALAPHVRSTLDRATFEKRFLARRAFGRPLKRSRDISYSTSRLAGQPDGSYMAVTFSSSFEKKSEAREGVVLSEVSRGDWKVVNWNYH